MTPIFASKEKKKGGGCFLLFLNALHFLNFFSKNVF